MSKNLATLIGLSAILMWASMVGLIKYVSSVLNPTLGITLIYSFSAIFLLLIFRFPNFKQINKTYLIVGALLFTAYELCFSFAIAYSKTAQQAIEVSIVNYLWPSFTIAAFVIFKELKFNALIILGLLISISGIIFIQTGSGSFSLQSILNNVASNPLSYILALIGAIIWALYCVITRKMSNGHNPIALFFLVVAATLWLKLFLTHQFELPPFDLITLIYVMIAACAIGFGYAAWNIGIIQGNITVLVIASYFTPIISSILAMMVLQTQLSSTFWQGTALVTFGSFICWISTNWIAIQPFVKKNMRKIQYLFKTTR